MSIKTKYTGIFLALVLISGFATECNGDGLNTATKNTAKKDAASRSNAVSITYSNRSIDFGKGWKFALVNPRSIEDPTGEYKNAQNSEYDDSAWRVLDVPHDWSIELLPTADADANTDSGTGYLQGGLGWYRKKFTLPPSMKGKRISIEFDGVYMDSYVYINGQLLGNHPYGYTGFNFDLTGLVYTDGVTPNTIAVKVQNQLPSSRWYSGSGIYRNVHLTVTDNIHVERWGTFVTTPDLESTYHQGYAEVHIRTDVANEGNETKTVDLISRIIDVEGNIVAQGSSNATIFNSQNHTYKNSIRVYDPVLWSFENPYLYTLESDLVVDGKVVDTYLTTFGIRYFKIDPNEGFSLNGKYSKIQGVNLHHDLGALGSAVNYGAIVRQMELMKSMGVNAIRTSHNPPAPEVLQAADRLGIVMMVEAFDCWQSGKTKYDYARFFDKYSDADIREMVNAARNSPSVIIWSIGNEIRYPDAAVARRLINDVRSIDTTRPVVWGSDGYRSVPGNDSAYHQILLMLDGLGLNYNTAASVDALHAKYPDKFLFESESSSSTSTRGVYQEPKNLNTGEDYTPGHRGCSSYDNNLASWTMSGEYGLKKDRDRKYFAGQFLWSGFDYIGEPTPFYDIFPVKSSFFGAVDTAGFPKDQYYLFRSQWTSKPMVHILPMDWTDHQPGEEVQIWAYANVDTVELFLNGKSMGVRTFDRKKTVDGRPYLETTEATFDDKTQSSGPYPGSYTSPTGSAGKLHLTWNIPFEPGSLVAVAMQDGHEVARDELNTAGAPYAVRLTPDKKVINARSLSYITAEIVDSNGIVVPNAGNLLNFIVKNGALAGVDNGRQESSEGYKTSCREAFKGKALAIVQSAETQGPITITATSLGLLPDTTTVYSVVEADGSRLIALEPVYTRTMVGVYPSLPSTVEAIYVDGALRSMPVKWDEFEKSQNNKCGIYRIKGRVTGERARAEAIITVYDAGGIESYSTVVPAGVAPALPATVRLVYNDGVDQFVPVAWDPVDPSAGQFTVSGRVAALKVQAHIRVTEDVTRDQNIARSDCPLKPAADASYSGTAKSIPAAMLDGINSSGGWSNYYYKDATALLPAFSKARPREWVKISWPNPQRLDNLRIYFTVNDSMSQPLTMKVSYWDGDSFVPVDNLSIAWAATSEEATTVTFNPVTTTQLRLDMISRFPDASNGFLEIRELEIPGDIVAYNTDAYLTDLKVNGQTIKEFDRNTTVYTVLTDGRIPEISAIAADNARIIIVPPLTIPGTAVITVTSEEGLTQRTYYINLDAGGTATSGALLTWFRDNFCENNISYGTLDREAEKIQPGSNGLIVLPYFSGERTPILDEKARGLILGLTLSHGRSHIYRALLEATAYCIKHHFDIAKEKNISPKRVLIVNGGAKSKIWRQIISDVTDLSLEYAPKALGAPFGDAYAAGLGIGEYKDLEPLRNIISIADVRRPRKEINEKYSEYYSIFRRLYTETKDEMHKLWEEE